MWMKLSLRDLNLDSCLPHPINTYTCKVTIMPRVRDSNYLIDVTNHEFGNKFPITVMPSSTPIPKVL